VSHIDPEGSKCNRQDASIQATIWVRAPRTAAVRGSNEGFGNEVLFKRNRAHGSLNAANAFTKANSLLLWAGEIVRGKRGKRGKSLLRGVAGFGC
jgi:hypothetical protein